MNYDGDVAHDSDPVRPASPSKDATQPSSSNKRSEIPATIETDSAPSGSKQKSQAEPPADADSDSESFVHSRPKFQASSILPPAAFFAPKRKQPSTNASSNNRDAARLQVSSPTWPRTASKATNGSTSSLQSPQTTTSPNGLFDRNDIGPSMSRTGSNNSHGSLNATNNHHASTSSRQINSRSNSPAWNASQAVSAGAASRLAPSNSSSTSLYNRNLVDGYGNDDRAEQHQMTGLPSAGAGMVDQKAMEAYHRSTAEPSSDRPTDFASKSSREPLLDYSGTGGRGARRGTESSIQAHVDLENNPSGHAAQRKSAVFGQDSRNPSRQSQSRKRNSHSDSLYPKVKNSLPGHVKTSSRNHSKFGGSNRFFLFGLIMTSADNPLPFLGSLLLLLVLGGLFFGFVAPYIWQKVTIAGVVIFAYVWLVAVVNMIVTAWRDPGVLPRNLDPDPPCTIGDSAALDPEDPLAVPLPRLIRVRDHDVKVKWCETCGTYRAPRCSHCRVCDNCVENIDHHCTFLNTCIGRRNYFSFLAFLTFSILSAIICIVLSVYHLYFLAKPTDYALPRSGFGSGYSASKAMSEAPVSVLLIVLTVLTLLPVLTLFGYHIRLICLNLTTVEQIRLSTTKSYDSPSASDTKAPNCCGVILNGPSTSSHPFANRSTFRNVTSVLARPTPISAIERYKHYMEDSRRDNPGWRSGDEEAMVEKDTQGQVVRLPQEEAADAQ